MIVSKQHRFIFVAVPKTGTHSVRKALRPHLGAGDMEQARLFVEKQFPILELARLRHGHISLQQVRPFVGDDFFESSFKFGFVRNPFDRFVSYCAFATRPQGLFDQDPKGVMRHFLFIEPPVRHIVFQSQHSFLTGTDGRLLADYVGRVEEMQQSYDVVCERIGIPPSPLERVNQSRRRDYREYYDQALVDAVAKLYARDLELFGYDF